MVPSTSAVSVLVIDCTTIGAPPPTATLPTITCVVLCRGRGPATSDGFISGLFMRSRISGFGHLHQGGGSADEACAARGTRSAESDYFQCKFSDLCHRFGLHHSISEAYIGAHPDRLKAGRLFIAVPEVIALMPIMSGRQTWQSTAD